MNGKRLFPLLIAASFFRVTLQAQEFPIAVGSDSTFSGGAVYGGSIGIAAVQGDVNSQYTINAQLIGPGGTLVGQRIPLGTAGVFPGAIPTFDGTNYFFVWLEFNGTLKGQFLNTSGGLVGASLTIATNVSVQKVGTFRVVPGNNMFLVAYVKPDSILYGRRVDFSGSLIGGEIQISSNLAREISLAFDGTNFLAAWVKIIQDTDKDIYGQFVSSSGTLVGSNVLLEGGPNYSDNPTYLAFDGTRYLLVYHDQPPGSGKWFLMGRFISTSGAIEETVTIRDTSDNSQIPSLSFDGQNYLITWTQMSDMSLMGRFYNKSGAPVDAPFTIFAPVAGKMPVGGVGFGGGLYLAVATRVDMSFTNGDVYGRFITPLTGVADKQNAVPVEFRLEQNYPNPFNPSTSIAYTVGGVRGPETGFSFVHLAVYDILGREVAVLVNERKAPGAYTVQFDATGLASGVYLYRLTSGDFVATRSLLLLK